MTRSTWSAVPRPSPVNRMSAKMMWPDCSPPSERPRDSISSITYLSPTGAAHQLDAALAQRHLEADVAHHRGDDGVARQPPLACICLAHSEHHGVAVHDAAAMIDEDGAVAVAVEGDAEPGRREHDFCAPAVGASIRSQVDVPAVGLAADATASKPSSRNSAGATVVVAPLAQSTAMRIPARPREARRQDAGGARGTRPAIVDRSTGAAAASARTTSVGHDRLDLRSSASVNFSPAPENTLMPLSSKGLCEAEITTPACTPSARVR
jgi:hypothetical protein